MFCSNCGTKIEEGQKFCPNCGAPVTSGSEPGTGAGMPGMASVTPELGSVTPAAGNAQNTEGTYSQDSGQAKGFNPSYTGSFVPLKTDRSLLIMVLLSIVTCGIYFYIFLYMLIKDVDTACQGDGQSTPDFWIFLLLSVVTCGIYSFIWYYKLGNRLCDNCARYGNPVPENGTTVLLWMLLGQFVCMVGPFIAWHIIITNTNVVCAGYNKANAF